MELPRQGRHCGGSEPCQQVARPEGNWGQKFKYQASQGARENVQKSTKSQRKGPEIA
jgi:hypothetical protein